MPLSEARKRANKKWNDANMKNRYDRIQLLAPKGRKDEIQSAASSAGQSLSGYILQAVDERMQRDTDGAPAIDETMERDEHKEQEV